MSKRRTSVLVRFSEPLRKKIADACKATGWEETRVVALAVERGLAIVLGKLVSGSEGRGKEKAERKP